MPTSAEADRELVIAFEGWFLCRLATDPDPSDEPRGVSGSTFALPGEPDLDRVIVLHDPAPEVVRSYAPPIGVFVADARVGDKAQPAFVGARVDLLGKPRFENRNFVLTVAGREPIVPFHIRISRAETLLARPTVLWPQHPDAGIHTVPEQRLESFGARGFGTDRERVLRSTQIGDPLASRRERRRRLVADRARERDPLRHAALSKRIHELDMAIADPANERNVNLTAVEDFQFELFGQAIVGAEAAAIGARADVPWSTSFWMGGWDSDVLAGFMKGSLRVPLSHPDRTKG
jgi:hypothetical protein